MSHYCTICGISTREFNQNIFKAGRLEKKIERLKAENEELKAEMKSVRVANICLVEAMADFQQRNKELEAALEPKTEKEN